ncbi:hypothetical protein AB0B89_14165, partial [Sphaerisporangium sp. NPDC049002]|uniref:hypothetical protein n=1 Tax=Sphaerisporangium sp. NPDC049002 TaxID=3155392 RepID=UPI0033F17CEF
PRVDRGERAYLLRLEGHKDPHTGLPETGEEPAPSPDPGSRIPPPATPGVPLGDPARLNGDGGHAAFSPPPERATKL